MRTTVPERVITRSGISVHTVGVVSGLAAGAWLGSAEAPTKLVSAGYSPAIISLCMVSGVFVARWTLPTLMKGTSFVLKDTLNKAHLIVWGIIAGALWAVANTLTVFAIRDVGLSIAFPLWNTNSLVGILWGWLLFGELRGGGVRTAGKVLGGTLAILIGTVILTLASVHSQSAGLRHPLAGVLAALGASLLWGTMYVPYRKAYLSGMNPLSFVTVFTFGELGTMITIALVSSRGLQPLLADLHRLRPSVFWLFLGGFCWVIGDLFQHFATKYIGISRGIPLSNTNQFWGLAWGALVFGELAGLERVNQVAIVLASFLTLAGAVAIGAAVAKTGEVASSHGAIAREAQRYRLNYDAAVASQSGAGDTAQAGRTRSWWDVLIVAAAVAIFGLLWRGTVAPPLQMNVGWIAALLVVLFSVLAGAGWLLWRCTRFC